ncbi:MAG: glycosyltransferase [Ferruginibacter sp.]
MKILFIVPSFADGGQEKAGMILCNYLMQYHQVLAVCFEPPSPTEYNYKCDIQRIVLTPKSGLVARLLGLIEKVKRLKKIKQHFNPDVSISFGDNAIVANCFTRTNETKIASLRHSFKNSLMARTAGEKIYDSLYKFSLKKADMIVPVSNEINGELKKLFNIENKLFVTNGYDFGEINFKAGLPLSDNLKIFFNDKVIAHVGRFDAQKCQVELVKFFIIVKQKEPAAKLMLVGGIDQARPQNKAIYEFCISYLQKNGCEIIYADKYYTDEQLLNADVLITGRQINPFQFLSKATLFVFPSLFEGFPNALMEAMACGLPVISSECPTGPKEILHDENSNEIYGLLLPLFDHRYDLQDESINENHVLWAATIIELLNNKNHLKQLCQQSNKRVQHYTIDAVCKKWMDILSTGKN